MEPDALKFTVSGALPVDVVKLIAAAGSWFVSWTGAVSIIGMLVVLVSPFIVGFLEASCKGASIGEGVASLLACH